jgi:hypothetical protein
MLRSRVYEITAIASISRKSAPKLSTIRAPRVSRPLLNMPDRFALFVRGVTVAIFDVSLTD